MNRHTFPTGFNIGSSQADVWTPSNLEFESKHQIYIHSNEVPTGPNMARRVFTLGVAIPFQLLHFPFQKRSSQEICFTEHWRQLYYHSCHLRLNRNRKSQWPNIWQRCWMWEKARSLPNGIQISTPKKKTFEVKVVFILSRLELNFMCMNISVSLAPHMQTKHAARPLLRYRPTTTIVA